jgi:rhodanese-related sulfurtransferase
VRFFADPQNLILILVALVSGAMLVWPLVRRSGAGGAITTGEAVRLINREKGVLIDVGEPAEYAAGHAAGARSVPFGQLEGSKDLPSNKALPLLVLCPTGARSARAAALLRKSGHERAVAVAGGTAAWRDAQLPVERSAADKAGSGKGGDKAADKGAEKGAEKGADKPGPKPNEKATEKSA